jgi:hypothetical protein
MKSRRVRRMRHTRGRGRRGGVKVCNGQDMFNGPDSNNTNAFCDSSNQGRTQGSIKCTTDENGNCKWVNTVDF